MNKELVHAWVQAGNVEKTVAVLAVVINVLLCVYVATTEEWLLAMYIWFPQVLLMLMLGFQPRPAHITGAIVAIGMYSYIFYMLLQTLESFEGLLALVGAYYILYVGLAIGAWLSVVICRKKQLSNAWACGGDTTLAALLGSFGLLLLLAFYTARHFL